MAEPLVSVQCVCGRMKQRGFICDFCFSTEDVSIEECPGCSTDGSNPMGLQGHLPTCIYNAPTDA